MSINLTQNYTFKKIEKQKEIKSINASYDQLCKQHSKLDKKLQEVFKDLKDIKSKSDSQERELMKKQKTIESLIEEKCELSSLVQDHKNYIRKLEAKVAIGAKGSSDISFTKQFQIQTQKKNALETELNEAFHKIQELEDHISVISRALEVKAQEMGNLNPVTLLNIGQNKEIMNKFRDKERELEIQTEELKIALDQSYETIEKLTQANEKSLTEALNLQNKLIQSENEKKKYQEKYLQADEEKKSLLEYIDEMNQTSNKPTQHKEYKKLLELKQSQIEELQMKYDQIENKLFEYEKNAQSKHNESNKYNKIEASNDYTKKIADLERIIREKNKEIQELKDREKDLASEIEIFKHQSSGFSKPGLEVNEKYEKLCLDIEELRDERDQLKEAMNEAINQCATSLVKQQALEKENQKFLKQVENLSNSKLLMQTTMADQINSLRGQIQRLKEEKTDRSIKIINE